jgi:hypothetical protein
VDTTFYGAETNPSQCRAQVLQHYAAYANLVEKKYGLRTRRTLTKPLLGLFWNEAGGRIFRSEIDQLILHGRTTGYGALSIGDIILKSAESLSIETLNMSPQQWQNAMMNDYQGKGRPQTC